jgi:hypothetical protein
MTFSMTQYMDNQHYYSNDSEKYHYTKYVY